MIVVISTYPDKEKAEDGAAKAVEKDLVACANIVKIENSIYKWKGKTERHSECLLIMKTTEEKYQGLETFIKEHHPYDVPEIIYYEIKGGNEDYIKWVESLSQ